MSSKEIEIRNPTRVFKQSPTPHGLVNTGEVLTRGDQIEVIGEPVKKDYDHTEHQALPIRRNGREYFVLSTELCDLVQS